MSKLSNFSESSFINFWLRNTAYSSPTVYLALHTGDPGETGANECAGGNYSRVIAPTFSAASARSITSTTVVRFPLLVAAIGTITHVSAWDAFSNGNMLWYSSAMISSIVTAVGKQPTIAAGGLVISMSGEVSTYAANKWLDLQFRAQPLSSPGTSLYASLHTADPGLNGASEVSGNAYARVQVSAWNSPNDGATANTNDFTFATPTPSNWGTITHAGIWDAASGGNFLITANLDASFVTGTFYAPDVMAGDLDVVAE